MGSLSTKQVKTIVTRILGKKRKRPYRNYYDFRSLNLKYKTNDVRCNFCYGVGRVVADYEVPDPVEGYKMADRVTCTDCNGTGVISEKSAKLLYKKIIDDYVKYSNKYDETKKSIKSVLSKLTYDDVITLRML